MRATKAQGEILELMAKCMAYQWDHIVCLKALAFDLFSIISLCCCVVVLLA